MYESETGWYLMTLGQNYSDSGWYLVALGYHKLVLLGTWWYRVSIGLLCLYKLKKWRLGHMSQMCLS